MRSAVRFLLLVLFALPACGRKYDVLIENDVDPSAPATVLVLGEPEPSTVEGAAIRVRLPKTTKRRGADGVNTTASLLPGGHRDKPGAGLTVRLDTKACGSIELCPGFADERAEPKKGEVLRATLRWRKRPEYAGCTEEVHRLFVDNRGGAARKIAIGGVAREVAANAVTTLEVPAPPCAAMADVALDGESIGTLPVYPANPDYRDLRPRDFVVDPTASRCYLAATVSYTPNGSAEGGSDPTIETFEKAWFHAVTPRIDTPFLERAPERIESYAGYGSRSHLIEIACRE